MRARRIRSRIALFLVNRLQRWIIGVDVERTAYGRLAMRVASLRMPEDRNPLEVLDRIIRERASARHQMQRQQEVISRQQETISLLVPASIERLTAEVNAFNAKLEAKLDDRPTAWAKLDDDQL